MCVRNWKEACYMQVSTAWHTLAVHAIAAALRQAFAGMELFAGTAETVALLASVQTENKQTNSC